ncbi:MAG: lysostaphin resistance A-like protein [Gemmatimonadales bacterium]
MTGTAPAVRITPLKAIAWTIAFIVLGTVLMFVAAVPPTLFFAGGLTTDVEHALTIAELTIVQGVSGTLGFGLATWLVGVRAARLSWKDLRWRGSGLALRGGLLGFALGGAASALAMALAVVVAGASWLPDQGTVAAWLGQSAKSALVLLPAAAWEEFAFRGVPLVLLAAAFGRLPAVLVTSAAFAVLHGLNPSVTPLGLANIGLAGIFLAMAFWAPGGIWTATGAHLGWNTVMASLDAPVSGLPFAMPFIDYAPGAPAWLTGGSFGPEGGVLATLTIIGATGAARYWQRKDVVA